MDNQFRHTIVVVVVVSVLTSAIVGGSIGFWAGMASGNAGMPAWVRTVANDLGVGNALPEEISTVKTVDQESAIISAVDKVSPAVVSIIITKDLPIIERYYTNPYGSGSLFEEFFGDSFGGFFGIPQYRQKGTQKQEVGGGTGFIVSSDGYILTNRHVVEDEEAEYTVLMNDGAKYPAKALARDQINDLAVLKIEKSGLKSAELGDSTNLKVGQTVIAIGNSLGEFRNTVSTGVISGLSRSITAGGAGIGTENLVGVIQTDASINPGNSGGPLLNIAGQVIGINTAMAQGAENIGFAIPVNEIKNAYESVKRSGKIVRPWLGVRYSLIDKETADANKLPVDYGALIVRGETASELAVVPGSPADKAGLVENDIILEVDGKRISADNPLANIIARRKAGDELRLKILHKGEEKEVKVRLEEMK